MTESLETLMLRIFMILSLSKLIMSIGSFWCRPFLKVTIARKNFQHLTTIHQVSFSIILQDIKDECEKSVGVGD